MVQWINGWEEILSTSHIMLQRPKASSALWSLTPFFIVCTVTSNAAVVLKLRDEKGGHDEGGYAHAGKPLKCESQSQREISSYLTLFVPPVVCCTN